MLLRLNSRYKNETKVQWPWDYQDPMTTVAGTARTEKAGSPELLGFFLKPPNKTYLSLTHSILNRVKVGSRPANSKYATFETVALKTVPHKKGLSPLLQFPARQKPYYVRAETEMPRSRPAPLKRPAPGELDRSAYSTRSSSVNPTSWSTGAFNLTIRNCVRSNRDGVDPLATLQLRFPVGARQS